MSLTQARLQKLVYYDPDTGILAWAKRAGCAPAGAICGHVRPDGYIEVRVDRCLYLAHRLAWLYVHGEFPENKMDHIDHVRTNNRLANLRLVTDKENGRNQKLRHDNTSGVTGVRWHKQRQKWYAQIKFNGKSKYIGYYTNLDAATVARNAVEMKCGFHENHGAALAPSLKDKANDS